MDIKYYAKIKMLKHLHNLRTNVLVFVINGCILPKNKKVPCLGSAGLVKLLNAPIILKHTRAAKDLSWVPHQEGF